MKKLLLQFIAMSTLAVSQIAFAGNNAAPLGVELGVASYDQVKQSIGKKTNLFEAGVNSYSGGPMLKGTGEGLEIDGLQEITLIFDKENHLAGLLMKLPKGGIESSNVKQVIATMSKKYKLVNKNIPFVGDAYARFKQGDSTIEVIAPHMGFEMEIRYLSDKLLANFNASNQKSKSEKDSKRANQL